MLRNQLQKKEVDEMEERASRLGNQEHTNLSSDINFDQPELARQVMSGQPRTASICNHEKK